MLERSKMDSVWILTNTKGWLDIVGVYTTEINARIAQRRAINEFMLEYPDCESPDIYFYITEEYLDDKHILNAEET